MERIICSPVLLASKEMAALARGREAPTLCNCSAMADSFNSARLALTSNGVLSGDRRVSGLMVPSTLNSRPPTMPVSALRRSKLSAGVQAVLTRADKGMTVESARVVLPSISPDKLTEGAKSSVTDRLIDTPPLHDAMPAAPSCLPRPSTRAVSWLFCMVNRIGDRMISGSERPSVSNLRVLTSSWLTSTCSNVVRSSAGSSWSEACQASRASSSF